MSDQDRNSINKGQDAGDKKEIASQQAAISSIISDQKYEDTHFVDTTRKVWNYSLLNDEDISNFQQGTHYRLYQKFGSHSIQVNGKWGMYFCVWAPNATSVSVIGNFNHWKEREYELDPRWDKSGIWEGFIPGFNLGESYKYHIVGYQGREVVKGDPFANFWEKRPKTASITWDMYYEWKDKGWMETRKDHNALEAPWSVYEVHLASWQRPDRYDEESYNTYEQITASLVPSIHNTYPR